MNLALNKNLSTDDLFSIFDLWLDRAGAFVPSWNIGLPQEFWDAYRKSSSDDQNSKSAFFIDWFNHIARTRDPKDLNLLVGFLSNLPAEELDKSLALGELLVAVKNRKKGYRNTDPKKSDLESIEEQPQEKLATLVSQSPQLKTELSKLKESEAISGACLRLLGRLKKK